MARKQVFNKPHPVRLTQGMHAMIEQILRQGETKTEMMRFAIQQEIERRKRERNLAGKA